MHMVKKTHMMGLLLSTLILNLQALITSSSIPFLQFTAYNLALLQLVKKKYMTRLLY